MSDPIRRDPPYVFCVRFLFQALIICIDLPLSSLLRWSTRHILTPPPTFSTGSSSLAGCQVRYSLNSCCCLLFSWLQSMDFVLNFVANKRLGPLDSRVSFLFLLLLAILLYVFLFESCCCRFSHQVGRCWGWRWAGWRHPAARVMSGSSTWFGSFFYEVVSGQLTYCSLLLRGWVSVIFFE